MKIHILGICGTFMAGIAHLAKSAGFTVTGSDEAVYPPMSDFLAAQDISIYTGFDEEQLKLKPDLVIIGNAMKRGNPTVEAVLNLGIPYTSGPQWLAETILQDRWVLAVSGTHGKTTTASMLAWILESEGLNPGFLIGGMAHNFNESARLGDSPFFVIEADEYDTAFFDKRSKFIHYHPNTLIINNLEFDHADIFSDLSAIQTQFHHLIRTVPNNGLIITPENTASIDAVIEMGCWTPVAKIDGQLKGLTWDLLGQHNIYNAQAALTAAGHIGISADRALIALNKFRGVKRRLDIIGEFNGITLYDDFAHHPTAIKATLEGLREKIGKQRLIAVLECGSYTMRTGVHTNLEAALSCADRSFIYDNKTSIEIFAQAILTCLEPGDQVVIMSNRSFGHLIKYIQSGLARA